METEYLKKDRISSRLRTRDKLKDNVLLSEQFLPLREFSCRQALRRSIVCQLDSSRIYNLQIITLTRDRKKKTTLKYIILITFDAGTLLVVSRYYGRRSGPSNQLTMVLAGSGPVRDVVEHSVDVVTQKQMVSKTRLVDLIQGIYYTQKALVYYMTLQKLAQGYCIDIKKFI